MLSVNVLVKKNKCKESLKFARDRNNKIQIVLKYNKGQHREVIMVRKALIKAIQTPDSALLNQLANAQTITIQGKPIKAVPLMEDGGKKQGGGVAEAVYLYQNDQGEYRVLKKVHPEQSNAYGGVARKIDTFNGMYNSIYDGGFSDLATARPFENSKDIMDMPYIGGSPVSFDEGYNLIDEGPQKKLFEQFEQSGYFITDYRVPGNVVEVTDSLEGRSYLLVRDVDLLGRRNSLNVTPQLLQDEFPENQRKIHYEKQEEYQKFRHIHADQSTKSLPKKTGLEHDFEQLQQDLLAKMTAKKISGPVREGVEQATHFVALCNAACQHHTPLKFYNSDETQTMGLLRDLLKKGHYPDLKKTYQFDTEKLLNVQLRSIGATRKNIMENTLAKQGDNLKKARDFFRELYHVDFNGEYGNKVKESLATHAIFHDKNYLNELKSKLKGLKEADQKESTSQIKPFK